MGGWIKLHRDMADHWLWEGEAFTKGQAWVDLLLWARHAPGKVRIKDRPVMLEKGQQARSEVTLAQQWRWSRGKVRRFLSVLEGDGMIVQHKSNHTSIITICNYEEYQESRTSNDTPDDTATEHQVVQQPNIGRTSGSTRNKKGKKGKKGFTPYDHPSDDPDQETPPAPAKGPSQAEIDDAFEVYWSAGMRKTGKKTARKAFAAVVKRLQVDPGDFARQLHDDVTARLAAQQMGFDRMHPTTYLNGERWNDEIYHDDDGRCGPRLSPLEEFEQSIRERDAQEESGGLGVEEDDRTLRGELDTRTGESSFIDLDSSDWQTRRG